MLHAAAEDYGRSIIITNKIHKCMIRIEFWPHVYTLESSELGFRKWIILKLNFVQKKRSHEKCIAKYIIIVFKGSMMIADTELQKVNQNTKPS